MFEGMIRSMKKCLKKLLGRSKVGYEQLQTLLAEIQTLLNNRPLTFLYDEPAEEVLTPNHLLFGRKINLENISKSSSFNKEDLNKCSQHLHNLLEHFKNRWRTEYLTELRENQNCKVKDHEREIKEGYVVIIHDDKKSGALWSVAKVENILLSKDNKVRAANIKLTVVINRPIKKLYPIEPLKQTNADQSLLMIQEFVKLKLHKIF